MKKWEYIGIVRPTKRQLDTRGEDGWQLCAIDEFSQWIFKREVSD